MIRKKAWFLGLMAISIAVVLGTVACKQESKPDDAPPASSAVDPMSNHGIGLVKHLDLGSSIDDALAAKGAEVFQAKCSSCHKMEERYVGPALSGVTQRRRPEWIMNMILNPAEMTKSDPIAQELFATYLVQMPFQNVSEEETRAMLEYFRKHDSGAVAAPVNP